MHQVMEIKRESIVPCVSWNVKEPNLSAFDKELLTAWEAARTNGSFRYDLSIQGSSVLPGNCKFFAELNPERGENRRKPQEFHSVNDPFNPSLFNFTRIKNDEILFEFQMNEIAERCGNQDLLAINVSPISVGHSLLLPCVNKMQPQVLTQHSIELGLHLLLMSSTPAFRVAFNSLLGYASVNHLHLHCLYVDNPMSLESIELQPFQGPCLQLINFPGKGFAFQCHANCENDLKNLSRNVFKLTNFLYTHNEAHNVIITRAKLSEKEEVLSYIRVYIWVRTSNSGAKEPSGFNPAALELFGYIVYKNLDKFRSADEASISRVLDELTAGPFERNSILVKQLFKE